MIQNDVISGAQREGRAEGYSIGHAEGYSTGRAKGREEGREEGRAEGREEGRAEGREEGRAEIVRQMKANGMTTEMISKITGLSANDIDNIN